VAFEQWESYSNAMLSTDNIVQPTLRKILDEKTAHLELYMMKNVPQKSTSENT
jgi:hypothetical protein